ncbi:phytoene synthase [Streptacidiphilus sp. MAP12-16]|uniref:phytoene/squalene synthase family protein n=1 Tax=Streptacidiphilus sp. MAP12-16 TaxID=3156300 RepID=UPI0035121A91
MSTWSRALDAAGIDDPGLRADYGLQRSLVARYKREACVAALLLLPRPLVPHVMAATAFMHHTDTLLDSGPRAERLDAYQEWATEVREGLAGSAVGHPTIRALSHTARAYPQLRAHIDEFLAAAATDLDFAGFTTEKDYQSYIDGYSLPGLMVVACLLAPAGDQAGYREACRTFVDGSQRLDFVNDLAEDLQEGRLTVPKETLERHGVTRADLEHGHDTPATRALLQELLEQARHSLRTGRSLPELTPPANRPILRTLIALDELTARAATTKGAALLRGSARPSPPAVGSLLLREYREARRHRR